MIPLIVLCVFAFVVVLLLVLVIRTFNTVARLRNATDNAWAQIDVQLTRRHDLIPNLVETVKGYAAHERQTLEAVIAARSAAISAQGPTQQAQAETALSGTLKSLLSLTESYPELRANTAFATVQRELAAAENRIAYARQYYNDAVLAYNNAITPSPPISWPATRRRSSISARPATNAATSR
ncbi:LemA family protein [Fodinicola feengrottensis]|uniref:LemA family protein n=1 Tax=Fodinicola feengrottensis TaxID=435914 RepID=UPI0013D417F1|nr:LemA family protein [Fodinicola feengrottensis]